jgi:hypothetical protein
VSARPRPRALRAGAALAVAAAAAAAGCANGVLDAGHDVPHGMLPVDERNAMIILNDWGRDNWAGEYAVLFANAGGPRLAGIVIDASSYWPQLDDNVASWTDLVTAARGSGLQGIPDVTRSAGAPLAAPADGTIESTVPNRSAGAQLIVDVSRSLGTAARPVVVVAGDQLTTLADAYLTDPTVADRIAVVAIVGTLTSKGATTAGPNGDLDPWATWIVTQRLPYVQISAPYDQSASDVTAAQVSSLPQNPLGTWMAAKQPSILTGTTSADQAAVIALSLPSFVTAAERVAPNASGGFGGTSGPPLVASASGGAWLATQVAAPLAGARLWQMLLDPMTYAH